MENNPHNTEERKSQRDAYVGTLTARMARSFRFVEHLLERELVPSDFDSVSYRVLKNGVVFQSTLGDGLNTVAHVFEMGRYGVTLNALADFCKYAGMPKVRKPKIPPFRKKKK